MSNFTNPLDNIRIASPCSADWNEMLGNERKRFCSQCSLNVYNLSGMTKAEAENLLLNSEDRLCVRFYRRSDGTILTQNCPVGWAKVKQRVSRIATAAFSMIAGFLGGVFVFTQIKFATGGLLEAVKAVEVKMEAVTKANKDSRPIGCPPERLKKRVSKNKVKKGGWANGRVVDIRKLESEPVKLWIY